MVCNKCGWELRQIHGGQKIKDDKIVHVSVLGCTNPDCEEKMVEKARTETEVNQFDG